jgi:hypothetical protein
MNKNVLTLNLSKKNIKDVLDLEDFNILEELDCSNNEITEIINIPYSLKYLNCSNNKIKSLIDLPQDLIGLNCKKNPLEILHYPINVKPLKYPSKLKKIIFGEYFNQQIDNLPNKLIEILFTEQSEFNQPINNLPNSLKILSLCNKFNNSLDYLPNSMTHLTIGNGCMKYFGASCKFNQSINNLPNSLIELTFSNECIFQKSLNNLPNSLKKITLSGYYTGSIDNLSDSIETIILGPTWLKYNEMTFDPLCLKNKIRKLPKSLKYLYVINYGIREEFKELNFNNLELLNKDLEKSYNNPYKFEYYLDYCGYDINTL